MTQRGLRYLGGILVGLLCLTASRPVVAQAPAQIQAALQQFLLLPHTWTATQTFATIIVTSCTGCGTSSVFKAGNGSASAPSYSFTNDTQSGLYLSAVGDVRLSISGADQARYLSGSATLSAANALQWGSSGVTSADLILVRDGAGIFAQRNGTTAQALRVYNTFTSSTNNERFSVDWQTTANVAIIGTRTAATGTGRTAAFVSQASSAGAFSGLLTNRAGSLPFNNNTLIAIGLFNDTGLNTVGTTTVQNWITAALGTSNATSGTIVPFAITPAYNQSGSTASNTDLLINRTETAIGSGAQLLFDAQVGSASKFKVDRVGLATFASGGGVAFAAKAFINTAPTVSSGFGTNPSIAANNGTGAFTINVGTGGSASSGVIGLPTATTGWVVNCTDLTTPGVNQTKQTAVSTTSATVTNYNTTTGMAAAWTASDILYCTAVGY